MRQAERVLQREIMLRLQHAPLQAIVVPSPNGVYLPARSPAERELARRLIHGLKVGGSLLPGAPDLTFLWEGGGGCVELKRPSEKTLFGRQRPGQLSDDQKRFRDRCAAIGVPYEVCQSWPQVRELLKAWGRLPEGWYEPEVRAASRRKAA